MNATSFQSPRVQFGERPAEPRTPQRARRGSKLLATLTRIATNGASHDEATFFRIEYGERASASRYTSARDEQLCAELLGPPPLGL
jgi:hypothetical protein